MVTLAQLADYLDGVWEGNPHHAIFGFSSLAQASSSDVCYFENPSLSFLLSFTLAGAVILNKEHKHLCPKNCIVVSKPYEAMLKAIDLLSQTASTPIRQEIDPSAQISSTAQLGRELTVGSNAVIGSEVVLGDRVRIGANTVIEPGVRIGDRTVIESGSIIHSGSVIGNQVHIDSGVIIGAFPFNYAKIHGAWLRGPVIGGVFIGDRVQIGANSVIDRGTLADTFIQEGVCIGNLVQVAHDVIIGAHTAIVACVAIASNVRIGSHCIIGGGACVASSVVIADDVVITGMSAVSKSINKSGIYSSGTLIHDHERWRRNAARFRRLDDYILRLNALEKQVENK